MNNMKDDKKSTLKEALTDYKEIMEAADINAKKKLADEFPDKFSNLLKEEINKNKKSTKESYKKVDDDEESDKDEDKSNKEDVMKTKAKETEEKVVDENVGESKPFDKKAKEVKKVEEDVKITDTVGKSDPFKDKAKKVQKVDETIGNGKPFAEKPKKSLQTEEFDITELDVDSVDRTFESADNNDEFSLEDDETISLQEIENEISQMENLDAGLDNTQAAPENTNGIAMEQLMSMKEQIDSMISNLGGVKEMHQAGQKTFGDTSQVNALHNQGPTDQLIDEDDVISDKEIEDILGAPSGDEEVSSDEEFNDEPVDEAHGLAYSSRRNMAGRHLPSKDYLSQGELDQAPEFMQESKKKINGLIKENKNLTKKLNDSKKFKNTVTPLLEQYKSALEKYRNQLREMAVFNTNLAHVNNLLVNESLALTQDDKVKIINEFKKIDSIGDSQKKYKTFLNEMKISRRTISESIEEKVTTSIQPSSKLKLDEVVEKTAYANDSHINRMKSIIENIEKRGKKIIK
jgi:hypothetical protein